jgi:hypothetical protein
MGGRPARGNGTGNRFRRVHIIGHEAMDRGIVIDVPVKTDLAQVRPRDELHTAALYARPVQGSQMLRLCGISSGLQYASSWCHGVSPPYRAGFRIM